MTQEDDHSGEWGRVIPLRARAPGPRAADPPAAAHGLGERLRSLHGLEKPITEELVELPTSRRAARPYVAVDLVREPHPVDVIDLTS